MNKQGFFCYSFKSYLPYRTRLATWYIRAANLFQKMYTEVSKVLALAFWKLIHFTAYDKSYAKAHYLGGYLECECDMLSFSTFSQVTPAERS